MKSFLTLLICIFLVSSPNKHAFQEKTVSLASPSQDSQELDIGRPKEDPKVNDLLLPNLPSSKSQLSDEQRTTERLKKKENIDELLGPEINFPFLPDNHRDSGTGKFNSF